MKYTDKNGRIVLDGEGDLMISSRLISQALKIDRDESATPVDVTGFHFAKPYDRYRIVRMWRLIKLI
jgi:hypothetical protein